MSLPGAGGASNVACGRECGLQECAGLQESSPNRLAHRPDVRWPPSWLGRPTGAPSHADMLKDMVGCRLPGMRSGVRGVALAEADPTPHAQGHQRTCMHPRAERDHAVADGVRPRLHAPACSSVTSTPQVTSPEHDTTPHSRQLEFWGARKRDSDPLCTGEFTG
jgi:hypothetical protein